jgi:hypothetical protein
MFSVLYTGSGSNHKADVAFPAQIPLLGTQVMNGELIGLVGSPQNAFNPFDLYGLSKTGRSKARPPHVVFADLDESNQAACAFLNAYGPLRLWFEAGNTQIYALWRKLYADSSPQDYFRSAMGIEALVPPRPRSEESIGFHCFTLKQFWEEQQRFELAARLVAALAGPTSKRSDFIRRALAVAEKHWKTQTDKELLEKATGHVKHAMNKALNAMSPRIMRTLDRQKLDGVWGCYSLIQALYLMLFLDVASRNTRIVICEKCGKLFYGNQRDVSFCSYVCENRSRALRAYHRGKATSKKTPSPKIPKS